MAGLDKQQVLDTLKSQGITNLDQLVDLAAKQSQKTDSQGNPIALSVFINPHYVGSH